MTELRTLIPTTIGGLFLFALVYILVYPEKAERVAGWIWRGVSRVFHLADRKAVAYSVQGDVNAARAALVKDGPPGIIDSKLRLRWANAEQAEAHMRDGDVVVFMRPSQHREENITNALVAYLAKAVIPRGRPYVDRLTMQAVDLTLARSILSLRNQPSGAMRVFLDRHLDPALAGEADLRDSLERVDAIDLHGWLTRIMLVEYQRLGELLYPSHANATCLADARAFGDWLANLAVREPGQDSTLHYKGRFITSAVIFVAQKDRLAEHGITPYRKRAKRLIYVDRCDSVYLMGRDANISAVRDLAKSLESDGLIEEIAIYEYGLRADFKARVMDRDRAIIVRLRRKTTPAVSSDPQVDTDFDDAIGDPLSAVEVFDPEAVEGVAQPEGGETSAGAESVTEQTPLGES